MEADKVVEFAITPAELRVKREPFPWDDQFIEKLRELENNEDDR